jgi:hypothetical protein
LKPPFIVSTFAVIGVVLSAFVWFAAFQYYRSEGTLLLESDLQEYRRFYEVIDNPSTLAQYQTLIPLSQEVKDAIDKTLGKQNFARSIADTVFRVSRQDAKEIGEAINFSNGGNPVLGMRMTVRASTPQVARDAVLWSGEFVRDALLRDALLAAFRSRISEVQVQLPNLDSQLAKERFEIESAQNRVAALNELRSRYKALADGQSQQTLLNVERIDPNKLGRFLSVPSQLIATESQIIDINQSVASLQRKRKQTEFELAFYRSLEKSATGSITGQALAEAAQKGVDQLVVQYKEDKAIVESVAEIQRLISEPIQRFTQKVRFISPPSLPSRVAGPSLLSTVLGGTALFVLLALIILYRKIILQILLGEEKREET